MPTDKKYSTYDADLISTELPIFVEVELYVYCTLCMAAALVSFLAAR
jgi:hypothetical protein